MQGDRPSRAALIVLALVVAAAAAVRLRLIDLPLERDEGEYAYAGRQLLEGVPPYRSVYTVKLPGTHLAYAVFLGVLGPSTRAVRIGVLLVHAASILLMYRVARRALEPPQAVAAAATFAVLSSGSTMLGMAGHATHFVVLFVLAGLALLPRRVGVAGGGTGSTGARMVCAGVLLGLAILMKQVGVFFLAAALWSQVSDPARRRNAAPLAAGAALPVAAVILWLAVSGALSSFWFWTGEYAWQYGSVGAAERLVPRLRGALLDVVLPAWPLWVLALLGLSALRTRAPELVGFVAASALAVLPGFHLRPHYFLVLAPALGLLVGLALSSFQDERWRHAAPWLAVLALAWPVVADRDVLLRLDPAEASRRVYGANPFADSAAIARAVAERTGPGDTVAVFGSEPQLPFLANRRSATAYVYVYPLMEPQPYARHMQEQMIAEIESARPAVVVDVDIEWSWLPHRASETLILDWRRAFLEAHYEPAGVEASGMAVWVRRE